MTPEQKARLNAVIEDHILQEVDAYSQRAERDVVLIRFLSDEDFALYEPDQFEAFGSAAIHDDFIQQLQTSIERLNGEVMIAYMNSDFYETWLGVNDFDDTRDLRITWARQQLRGLET